jgi:hypothetical protein
MKHFVILLSSMLAVNVFSCGRAVEVQHQTRSEFASQIAGILPPRWTLQELNGEVIITRQDPVRLFNCVALDISLVRDPDRFKQFVDRYGVTDNFRIRVRRAAKFQPAEYTRLKSINDQIVLTKSTQISSREFYEDDAMRSFDSRYYQLPQYYDDSSSIYVETSAHPYQCIHPRAVAEECDMIRNRFDSMFSRYSKDDSVKKLSYGPW